MKSDGQSKLTCLASINLCQVYRVKTDSPHNQKETKQNGKLLDKVTLQMYLINLAGNS